MIIFLFLFLALISPRLVLLLMWIFGYGRFDAAFGGFIVPLLGIIFLPITTLVYVIAYDPVTGVSTFGWIALVFAFFLDLGVHKSSSLYVQK